MKVKLTMELDVMEGFSKHYLDNVLCACMAEEGYSARIIGSYLDENDVPITEEFFVNEENIADVAVSGLCSMGADLKYAEAFVADENNITTLFAMWMEYVRGTENKGVSPNFGGYHYFMSLLQSIAKCDSIQI